MPVTPDENLFTPGSGCDAPSPHADQKLGAMLQRIKALTDEVGAGRNANAAGRAAREVPIAEVFLPIEPESFTAAGLTETIVESLVLKFLLARGDGTGREIADQIKLPFILVDQLLREMKSDQLVVHKGAAAMNDFQYHLSDMGRERAGGIRNSAPTSAPRPSRSATIRPASPHKPSPDNTPRPNGWKRRFPTCF